MNLFIAKGELTRWLDALAAHGVLAAPAVNGDIVSFKRVSQARDIFFGSGNGTLGPKGIVFPLSHTLFTVERKNGETKVVLPVNSSLNSGASGIETIVFGLRPCDAKGIALFDLPMLGAPADHSYAQSRKSTALIGIACSSAENECFCTSMGTGPHDASHVDVLLFAVDGGYIAQPATDTGRTLLSSVQTTESGVSPPPPPEVLPVPAEGIVRHMKARFTDKYWDRLADRCIHCNICSYVCPTCYCFDIRDYQEGGQIQRVRSWESCQAPGFSKIAGGYDPRSEKGPKLRQRFAHKLLYFPEEFAGALGCTGCGRCVRNCPTNIDVREIIKDVRALGGAA